MFRFVLIFSIIQVIYLIIIISFTNFIIIIFMYKYLHIEIAALS